MIGTSCDILMITHERAAYTRLSLPRLLDSCRDGDRVWVWQNGNDPQTVAAVEACRDHPRLFRFHHSPENVRLRPPTSWLWENAEGGLLGKVDDDCLVPDGWIETLVAAHDAEPRVGVLGCVSFTAEDVIPDMVRRKIRRLSAEHAMMQNYWIGGSGYLFKRECLEQNGLLCDGESFTEWCIRLSLDGWVNGWYHPFLYQDHMDDPRSPNTLLRTDADIERYLPLSAQVNGVTTVREWQDQLRRSARAVQEATIDRNYYLPWRRRLRNLGDRARRILLGTKRQW